MKMTKNKPPTQTNDIGVESSDHFSHLSAHTSEQSADDNPTSAHGNGDQEIVDPFDDLQTFSHEHIDPNASETISSVINSQAK